MILVTLLPPSSGLFFSICGLLCFLENVKVVLSPAVKSFVEILIAFNL